MDKAGVLKARSIPVSPTVADAYAAAKAAYAAGDLGPLQGKLAMNFLLDRSADNWKAALAKLKEEVGECPADEPIAPLGAMSPAFRSEEPTSALQSLMRIPDAVFCLKKK